MAVNEAQIIGFIQIKHHAWNRLSQVQGLVVHPNFRRIGIAKNLIEYVEKCAKARNSRGIYVDTPIDNIIARKFYISSDFHEAYIMPEFYDYGLDGITLQKLFNKQIINTKN